MNGRTEGSTGDPAVAPLGSPVLAVTVIDCVAGSLTYGKVLVVVRDPRANSTHPNTVSVPTQRLTPELGAGLTGLGTAGGWRSSDGVTGHDPLIYVVESVLSRKLGLADALELGDLAFEAKVGGRTDGEADYGSAVERIAMINVLVRIVRGPGWVPERSASFSAIRWVEPHALLAAFDTRKPVLVLPDADPLEVCIHGLCVSTTSDLVRTGALDEAVATGGR